MDSLDTTADRQLSQVRNTAGLVADHRQLEQLRRLGAGDKHAQAQALRQAAEQFEHMFMERWYNQMRQSNATLCPDSPLHSRYSAMFEDMLAQQQVAAGSGSGKLNRSSITYMIAKQFSKALGDAGKELLEQLSGSGAAGSLRAPVGSSYATRDHTPYRDPALKAATSVRELRQLAEMESELPPPESLRSFADHEDFVHKMMPCARLAAAGTGFNPLVMVAQAALETGWGRHVPKGNNYFGIKAGASWQGDSEKLSSPEFRGGRFVNEVSAFRKYDSPLESMRDYISFIKGNARYGRAVDKSYDPDAYFEEIQKAGYATDPQYAAKLKRICRQIAFMDEQAEVF